MGRDNSPYLTADEVAKYLRVTKQTAIRWMATGQIPAGFQLTPNGIWRIDRETFLAWLKAREQAAVQERMEMAFPRPRREVMKGQGSDRGARKGKGGGKGKEQDREKE